MSVSPQLAAEGPVRFSVSSDGAAAGDGVRFHRIEVRRAAGTIPSALIIVDDGTMPDGDWAVANAATFVPGSKIVISAGYDEHEEPIFTGIVVRIGIRIDGDNFSRLQVHCQDEAVRMTIARHNAIFADKTDSDILSALIGAHRLTADVAATTPTYGELVQNDCTDWDFMMMRAEVNGMLVIVEDGTVRLAAPAVSEPGLSVGWGIDLLDFTADIDARAQFTEVEAVGWDPKTQAVTVASAGVSSLAAAGNLTAATLAGAVGDGTMRLQSPTALEAGALKAWAGAQQTKAALSRLRGRMRFAGSAKAKVGGMITVAGAGERFSGDVFTGGVFHEIADGSWLTEVEFGLPATWFSTRPDIVAPAASGWLPGTAGLQVGVVIKLEGDPKGEQRVQVRLPVLRAAGEGLWARLLQFHASSGFGAFFLPEIGDEVVLGYFNDDPSSPVILGSLYSSNRAPAYALADENRTKALVTRSKARIEVDDTDIVVTISTPAGNKVVISDKAKTILVSDENGNTVQTSPDGITLDSPYDIKLTAKGGITLDAGGSILLSAVGDVVSTGRNVSSSAKVGFTAKGAASAELSASGQTTVRGAMVMIN